MRIGKMRSIGIGSKTGRQQLAGVGFTSKMPSGGFSPTGRPTSPGSTCIGMNVLIMRCVYRTAAVLIVAVLICVNVFAQTPQPFPRPGTQPPPKPTQPAPSSTQPPPTTPPPAQTTPPRPAQPPATQPSPEAKAPSATEVFFPIYPTAQFLASYDAGRGQRYYIYGATALFADVVTFYRTQLDEKGTLVFKEPPTHMFEIGRFREESMAFPPGVTVKDWAWGGSQGYVNPKPKGSPPRFPTIVMIVPPQPQGSGR